MFQCRGNSWNKCRSRKTQMDNSTIKIIKPIYGITDFQFGSLENLTNRFKKFFRLPSAITNNSDFRIGRL